MTTKAPVKNPSENELENQKWYLKNAESVLGPLRFTDLVQGLETGEFLWVDLAIRAGADGSYSEWTVINEIPELRAALGHEPTTTDAEPWIVCRKSTGGIDGPFSAQSIFALLGAGKIQYADFVWRESMTEWTRLGDVNELKRGRNENVFRMAPPAEASTSSETAMVFPSGEELLKSVFRSGTFPPPLPQFNFQGFAASKNVDADEDLVKENSWIKLLGLITVLSISLSAHAAQVLGITPLKLASDKPSLVFKTDATVNDVIDVDIRGKTGEILVLPSFQTQLKVRRKAGEIPTLDLAPLKLPNGKYSVQARIGDLRAASVIFIGNNDAHFEEELKSHLKQLAAQQQAEKKALYYSAKQLENLSQNLATKFDSTQSTPGAWQTFFAEWKSKVEIALRPIRAITENLPMAYPEEVKLLMSTVDKLNYEATTLNQSIQQKRSVAGESEGGAAKKDAPDIAREFGEMKVNAAKLSSQPQAR